MEQIISASGTQYGAVVQPDGSILMGDFTVAYKQLIDYGSQQQPAYIGLALPGTGSEESGWMLRKYVLSGTPAPLVTQVLFGSGNTLFDKRWDQRSGIYEAYS